ncbi:MAG: aminotransferase class V-fold PLP-dependent enzyme [Gemmatimonadota bacterium]|nr:aminotransferase class V-fold PLP-dependent enzyme [Gemmatimonadota bacterium]
MKTALHDEFAQYRRPDTALWTPGPHALTPAVERTIRSYRAICSHRSNDFKSLYTQAAALLREAFHAPEACTPLIFGHTGSYDWEMVAVNTPPDFRAVGLDMGAFSARWAEVFVRHGRAVDVLRVPWGHGIESEGWHTALRRGYDVALLTHNETATGVMLPVDDLCRDARRQSPEMLIAIDGVSIAGAVKVDIGSMRPDYYLWSLQKDFAIPAVGSVMIVSDRALEAAGNVAKRGYVLDLIEWHVRAADAQTPVTVSDLMLRCLVARLEEMLDEGEARFRRHRDLARMQRDWAAKHGLGLLAQPEFYSPTVTTILMPDAIPATEFVHAAKTMLNVQIAPGYGPMRNTAIRIAAMGSTSESEMERFLAGLSLVFSNWTADRRGSRRGGGVTSTRP